MKALIHKIVHKQAGFTLIEIMVAVVIMGILSTGISAMISQTIKENIRSRGQMTAIQQVENAGYWITCDTQMARTVSPVALPGFPLQLIWEDEDGDAFQVTYSLTGGNLQRSVVINGVPASSSIVARSVNTGSTLTKCSYSGGILTFMITSTVDRVSETRTYRIKNRPG